MCGLLCDFFRLLCPKSLEKGARSIVVIATTLGPTRFATSRNARDKLRAYWSSSVGFELALPEALSFDL